MLAMFGNDEQQIGRENMRLKFLGKDTKEDESPTLYDTDRNTYLVQGWRVDDPVIMARIDLGPGEQCVEVPRKLMVHLAKSALTDDASQAPSFVATGHGTYVMKGSVVTDSEALAQMKIPDHETVVEVTAALRTVMRGEYAVADR